MRIYISPIVTRFTVSTDCTGNGDRDTQFCSDHRSLLATSAYPLPSFPFTALDSSWPTRSPEPNSCLTSSIRDMMAIRIVCFRSCQLHIQNKGEVIDTDICSDSVLPGLWFSFGVAIPIKFQVALDRLNDIEAVWEVFCTIIMYNSVSGPNFWNCNFWMIGVARSKQVKLLDAKSQWRSKSLSVGITPTFLPVVLLFFIRSFFE